MQNTKASPNLSSPERRTYVAARIAGAMLALGALCTIAPVNADAKTARASLTRSVDVAGTPEQVWARIGAFCAIQDWHPAIGSCTEDGRKAPTRTLKTKDGAATFVELRTGANKAQHWYSYTFTSAPVPVTHYSSIFKVTAKGDTMSTVSWSGTWRPDAGKEDDALNALTGIYESGLNSIMAMFLNRGG